MPARICFFVKTKSPHVLERWGFYAQDIRALRELGHEVVPVTRIRDLRPADLYYVWWWTWAAVPLVYARLLGRPVVVTGAVVTRPLENRPRVHQWAIRRVLAGADANVFISRVELERFTRCFHVRNPRYAPLTVDTTQFRPDGERDPGLVFTIAWTGGVNCVRKCFHEMVEAAARVCRVRPSVRFVFAGEHGEGYPALRRQVDESGFADRITFPGPFSHHEKVEHMQRCAVYLQPSRYEGFGLAIAEAMSCGAPVITSPEGEVPVVAGDAAMMVDGTRPDEIAAALLRALDGPALRAEYGRRARARIVAEFDFERHVRELGAVVDEALGRTRAATTR
ncbi:MAG TPA: glycosyltransferase family 4 protein [Longimicrobium sp.]|nr:glycosyltransferase family 4 protein [Longimicrobium sp.]